jgi:hypothetical protein
MQIGDSMTSHIHLRLYEELNDFLPHERRKRRFVCPLNCIATVDQLLQSLKVPDDHVEIVLVNGESVGFSHRLKDGDWVSVYPVFESLNVKPLVRVRKGALRRIRFLVDSDLPGLVHGLRAMGFDVLDSGSRPLEEIIRFAEEERRILLTGNPLLAQSKDLSRVHLIRESGPREQLSDVLSRFDLMQIK